MADGVVPRWSLDGKWIYYSRNRPQQLYRVARTGGDPEAVSGTADGWVAEESSDSSGSTISGTLWNSDQPAKSAFGRRRSDRRVTGASSRQELYRYKGRNLVHDAEPRPQGRQPAAFYDFASKITRTVYPTEHPVGPGLTLAPDGRRILFTQQDRRGRDLMLVENFR